MGPRCAVPCHRRAPRGGRRPVSVLAADALPIPPSPPGSNAPAATSPAWPSRRRSPSSVQMRRPMSPCRAASGTQAPSSRPRSSVPSEVRIRTPVSIARSARPRWASRGASSTNRSSHDRGRPLLRRPDRAARPLAARRPRRSRRRREPSRRPSAPRGSSTSSIPGTSSGRVLHPGRRTRCGRAAAHRDDRR